MAARDPAREPDPGAHPRDPAPHCRRLKALREPNRAHKAPPGPTDAEIAYALEMLDHPREGVRVTAAKTLEAWRDPRAHAGLLAALPGQPQNIVWHVKQAVAACVPPPPRSRAKPGRPRVGDAPPERRPVRAVPRTSARQAP